MDLKTQCKRLVKELSDSAVSPERLTHYLNLLEQKSSDKSFIANLTKDLQKSFGYFSDPEMTGKNPPKTVHKIIFEWAGGVTIPPSYDAMGYGYTKDESGCFDDCGGFSVALVMEVADSFYREIGEADREWHLFRDLAVTTLAVQIKNIIESLIETPEFKKMPKEPEIFIGMGEHDDTVFPVYGVEPKKENGKRKRG